MKRNFASMMTALALMLPLGALAAGVVTSVKGEARAVLGRGHGPLFQGERLDSGTTVTTGPDAQAVIRFDDGQQVVLNQNTEFKIADYRFDEGNPAADRSVFDLVKGALRVVTGAIGKRSQSAFQLRAPQMTIGIRGTDFMVVLVNPAYISVTQGAVAATNAAGTATFTAGTIGTVAGPTALAATIPASSLPAAASGAFSNMSAVTISAAGGAASGAAGATTGAAAGGAGAGVGIAVGAAAAGVAAAISNHNSSTTHH